MSVTDSALQQRSGLQINEKEFRRVAEMVKSMAGINLTDEKRQLVSARLAKRLRVLNLNTLNEYLDYVKSDQAGDELVLMLDAISTNLTSFWRESDHFDFIVEKLLPKIESSGQREIKVWSAGCSTGEEPYGLAMLILGNLRNPRGMSLRILATDLSTRVLDVARRGKYGVERVKNIPPNLRKAYMTEERASSESVFTVSDAIKSVITFGRLNLMEEWPMKGPFDFILCRNVMIYFDKPTQASLVARFGTLLRSGGTLFVGHSESLAGIEHSYKYVRPTIYEKP